VEKQLKVGEGAALDSRNGYSHTIKPDSTEREKTVERIVFLDRATMGDDLELAQPGFAHEFVAHAQTTPDEVVERLQGATYAITNKVPITRDMLAELPDLRLVSVAATGYDQVDVTACADRGIAVTNVRGYARTSVPEHTLALMLALARGLVAYREQVIDGTWERAGQFCFFDAPIRELAGATLGIIGSGDLGQAVAERARALGMECLFAARKGATETAAGYTPFAQVIERADVLTLHCPLTPETRGLIGSEEFARMTRCPIVINCARGGVVDEAALADALEAGRISGAGIDCVAGEPPPADSPIHRIKHRPDVIVTPHVAWGSREARHALWAQLIGDIESFQAGKPVRDLAQS
jgi:glycerate dehydrogenase